MGRVKVRFLRNLIPGVDVFLIDLLVCDSTVQMLEKFLFI
jgi:hypothetical protein